jgi:hypothetical protein
MCNKQFKKIALLLIIGSFVGAVSAQPPPTLLKLGTNPYTINDNAALEVESTTRGFLLPRMTRLERNAIVAPVAGLQIWCTDCNGSSGPYIYTGTAWATIASSIAKSTLTTGKMGEAIAPTWLSVNSATINGVLVQPSEALPTETGIVLKEIIGNDFASFPYLDAAGNNTTTVFKTATASPVIMAGGAINMNVTLNPSNSTNPFYFSTYAKTPLGVDYGNPVVFNCADPVFTAIVDESGGSLMPKFSGTLKVNAGTPKGAITEYGYYCDQANPPTTKKVLSASTSFDALNASLDKDIFTANPAIIDLEENDYLVENLGTYYFQFYVIVSGRIVKSPVENWTALADPVTGGTAVATVASIGAISSPVNYGGCYVPTAIAGNSCITNFFPVTFNVTKKGTYADFTSTIVGGGTNSIGLLTVVGNSFDIGNVTLNFPINGSPQGLLTGTIWTVSRITGNFSTGALSEGKAVCDGTTLTTVVEVSGNSVNGVPTVWMDRNLGASHVASAYTDIGAYGCLYQWGRGNDGHASITWGPNASGVTKGIGTNTSTTATTASDTPGNLFIVATSATNFDWRSPKNNLLWQGISGINNPCPTGFRLPTITELSGQGFNDGSLSVAANSALKGPAPGVRIDGGNQAAGTNRQLNMWVSDTNNVYVFYLGAGDALSTSVGPRRWGATVRCIKN